MNLKNDLLLRTARGEKTERPPVWLMRQAGRILPQYRALRSSLSGFKELVSTPHLAAEVTIQPVDELGVDAAIMFSDILVVPECMGLDYELVEKVGPRFTETIQTLADIERMGTGASAADNLGYVYDAIGIMKKELDGRVPLIGFAGAPWTIMSYMIEGGGSKTFSKARRWLYQSPEGSHQLMQKITDTTIAYLKNQIAAGVNIVQVFDSWAGVLSPALYQTYGIPYLKQICDAIDEVPVIVFAKGAWYAMDEIEQLNCNVVGLDWQVKPQAFRAKYGENRVIQGNLDPATLYAPLSVIEKTAKEMLDGFGGSQIANLGHGVYPDTPLDGVKCFVDTVKAYERKTVA
ncbi:MAG: uroporphyrinogen decarboxylase [Saprospiraceae bacterium]